MKEKASDIKSKVKSVFFKISENVDRPKAVDAATQLIAATRKKMVRPFIKNLARVTIRRIIIIVARVTISATMLIRMCVWER